MLKTVQAVFKIPAPPAPPLPDEPEEIPLTLSNVKHSYYCGEITHDEAIAKYPEWQQQPTYMILATPDWQNTVTTGHNLRYGSMSCECHYHAVKLSKRGNDVYKRKIARRFKSLWQLCTVSDDIKFLSGKTGLSNLAFVTLTYDTKLTTVDDAWQRIGHDLNLYLSNIKKEFGTVQILRCYESFQNNYPHLHLIIRLNDHKLPVTRYRAKRDGKIHYKFSNNTLNKFDKHWHSHVLVDGVRNMGAVGYILKYITKNQFNPEASNTTAHLWLYHRQSYSISKTFESKLSNDIQRVTVQLDTITPNSNLPSHDFTFVTIVNGYLPHLDFVFQLEKPPPLKKFEEAEEIGDISKAFNGYI